MAGTKKVAVVGFGNIGSGVVELLYQRGIAGLELTRVVAVDLERKRPITLPASYLTTDWQSVVSDPEVAIVVELIGGLVRLMAYEGDDACGPINLGNTDERSMNDLVGSLGKILGRQLDFEYGPLPDNDPVRRCPDISRARERLGWEPTVTLSEGLRRTVEYFRDVTA